MALKQQATSSVPANQLTQEQIDILKSKGQYDTNAYYNPDYLATLNAGGGAREASPSGLSGQVQNVAQLPNISMPQAPSVGTPTVTPAPEYTISPEQQAWQEMYSQQLQQWIEAGGYGIPEETQAQMIQRTTDTLKAKEAEDIRVMRNNMERRGLTNSGLVFSNEQKIRANTTTAIANYISDVQIQSALMKMASFEKALGAAGEYLGYLSQQSQLAYQPKYATWQAQQQANLAAYNAQVQAKLTEYAQQMDVYKMQIAQAYEQQNMQLAHYFTMQELEFQANAERDIIKMQIEANERAARQAGKGQVVGTMVGVGLSLL